MRTIHEMRAQQSHNNQLEKVADLYRDLLQVLGGRGIAANVDWPTNLMV